MRGDHIKITFLGESATGKTSIAKRLVHNKFSETYDNTIGASFMLLRINNSVYDLWDTAGQERYLSLVQLYYRDTDIFLLVFDASQLSTLDRLNYYVEKILEDITSNYRILIIGNKIDLIDEKEIPKIDKIVKNKMSKLDKISNKVQYIYVAAKTGQNFLEMTNLISKFGDQIKEEKHVNIYYNIMKKNDKSNIINLDTESPITASNTSRYRYCYC